MSACVCDPEAAEPSLIQHEPRCLVPLLGLHPTVRELKNNVQENRDRISDCELRCEELGEEVKNMKSTISSQFSNVRMNINRTRRVPITRYFHSFISFALL